MGSPPVFIRSVVVIYIVFVCFVFRVLFFALFVFDLCLVYPMLPVSLKCSSLIAPLDDSSVYLCLYLVYLMLPVSLECSSPIAPSDDSSVYLSCILCTQCCQFLWSVHPWLPLQMALANICPVSCVSNVASFSGVFIPDCPFRWL
jgi:hypothetical protein